jgi:predicted small metal-binding protein
MKMYTLSCKDMGIEMCDFMAKGKTKEEVVKEVSEHFMKAHPTEAKEKMEKYSEKELNKMMMDKVHEEM